MMRKAPRHQGIKASRRSLAFSLIEVLLAVFILGVGVIAIAALFPAGIAQQRQSVDDTIGPIVANNALAVLRNKLHPEDFGTFEEFGAAVPLATIAGDWPWLRPAFILPDGAIDIFNGTGAATAVEATGMLNGIPYNSFLYPAGAGAFVITQGERYYPMFNEPLAGAASQFPPRPQYVWDCMFRRFQGKIMVAIFVYRVTIPGGGSAPYSVPPNYSDPIVPPLPVAIDLTLPGLLDWSGNQWDVDGDPTTQAIEAIIPGTYPDMTYNPSDAGQSWQAPGQWILDQNNNVHRVLSGRRNESDGPVELVRPVAAILAVPTNFALGIAQPNGFVYEDVVTNIWYIPVEVELDTDGDGTGDLPATLTPVYVTVREL